MKQNTVKSSPNRFWLIPQLQCRKCPLGVSAWQQEDNEHVAAHSHFSWAFWNVQKVSETKKKPNIHSFHTHENLISLSSVFAITNEGWIWQHCVVDGVLGDKVFLQVWLFINDSFYSVFILLIKNTFNSYGAFCNSVIKCFRHLNKFIKPPKMMQKLNRDTETGDESSKNLKWHYKQ